MVYFISMGVIVPITTKSCECNPRPRLGVLDTALCQVGCLSAFVNSLRQWPWPIQLTTINTHNPVS